MWNMGSGYLRGEDLYAYFAYNIQAGCIVIYIPGFQKKNTQNHLFHFTLVGGTLFRYSFKGWLDHWLYDKWVVFLLNMIRAKLLKIHHLLIEAMIMTARL